MAWWNSGQGGKVARWARGSWAAYSGLYHLSSSWQGLLSLAGRHGAGQCSGTRESQGAGINWVTCASCFEHKKRYKMLIITMRCLRAPFNLLVAIFYTMHYTMAKATVIVKIQEAKFWVI